MSDLFDFVELLLYGTFFCSYDFIAEDISHQKIPVAYAPTFQQAVFSLHAGIRKDDAAVLQAEAFTGYTVETCIAFLSNDETNASDSAYTGRISL